jgi:micrococcal nuclease
VTASANRPLAALAAAVLLAAAAAAAADAQAGLLQATIVRWTDGDTVAARLGASAARVRLIGIDTPEASASGRAARQAAELNRDVATIVALGRAAKAAAERLAPPGTAVRVELDVQTRDRYGRLLAYLWLHDGRMINEELVRAGYAMVLTVPPNVKYADRLLRAQQDARGNRRGLWGP